VAIYDRWHLAHPPAGAKKCSQHRGKVASAEHGKGLRWQVRGITDHDGRELPKENFEHEEDAKNRDAELRTAARAGTLIDEKGGKVLFKDYAERWRKAQTHDHPTAERVERMLRNHCYEAEGEKNKTPTGRAAIGGYSMIVLSRRVSLLRDWVAGLALSANTARLLIDTVTAIFNAAVDDLIVSRNPLDTRSVPKPKRTKTEVIAWGSEQIEAVCENLPPRLRAMGYLGAVTAPRQGELLALAVPDIDFLRKTVHYGVQVVYVGGRLCFSPTKNDRERYPPIADEVVPCLSEHIRLFPPAKVTLPWSEKGSKMDGKPVTRLLVFTAEDGSAYYRQEVNRAWKPAWKAAGIEDRGRANGMHILRHSGVSRWLSGGLNPAKVAAYIGDTVAVTISTYSHFMPDDDERGRAIMNGFVKPGPVPSDRTVCPQNALSVVG
jgi:integrase